MELDNPNLKLSYSVLILNGIFSKWHYFILFSAGPARSPFALFERTTSDNYVIVINQN